MLIRYVRNLPSHGQEGRVLSLAQGLLQAQQNRTKSCMTPELGCGARCPRGAKGAPLERRRAVQKIPSALPQPAQPQPSISLGTRQGHGPPRHPLRAQKAGGEVRHADTHPQQLRDATCNSKNTFSGVLRVTRWLPHPKDVLHKSCHRQSGLAELLEGQEAPSEVSRDHRHRMPTGGDVPGVKMPPKAQLGKAEVKQPDASRGGELWPGLSHAPLYPLSLLTSFSPL